MSTPDPNDPYKAPPPQAPPPPQGQMPQAPPPGAPYGSAPGPYGGGPVPHVMPSKPKTSRTLIYVSAGLLGLFALMGLMATLGDPEGYEEQMEDALGTEVSVGVFTGMFALFLVFALAGIALATQFGKGGGGIRTGAMIWAGLSIIVGLFSLPVGVVTVVLGILVLVFLSNQESTSWFNRPRH